MEFDKLTHSAIHMIDTLVLDEYSRILDMGYEGSVDFNTIQELMPFRSILCKHYNDGIEDSILKTYTSDMEEWIKRVVNHIDITEPLNIYKNAVYLYELIMDILYKRYNNRKLIKYMVKYDTSTFIGMIVDMITNIKGNVVSLLKQDIIAETDRTELFYIVISDTKNCIMNDGLIPYINTITMGIDKHYDITEPAGIYAMMMKLYTYIIIAFFMRSGFAEDIAMAAFSPKRVRYLIDNYSYDWIDNM